MAHLYLAAPQKSSGKTTLALGLCRCLRDRGLRVQPFKKGPDYIDPLWLSQAASRSCFNLDYHTMEPLELEQAFACELADADLGLIEGNVGLFDSTELSGRHSNAELAKQLGAPVVLVVNCQGLGRGIAPLLLGYLGFDPGLRIAGLILNKVGGARHARNLVKVVEHYTDLPVLGVIERDAGLGIEERHLGLMPSNEAAAAETWIHAIAQRVAATVDLEPLLAIAESATPPSRPLAPPAPRLAVESQPAARPLVRIGIARDAAFGFYYPDDLRALVQGGAELVPFSPLADAELPPVDALFIGGGFPECAMAELEANRGMRQAVAEFVRSGGLVYAECGGLMYLCESLRWHDARRAMVGVLAADVAMHAKPQGRGYVQLCETADFPWPRLDGYPATVAAHEFHHSALVCPHPDWTYAYRVQRGTGITGTHDGIVQDGLLACYSHLRSVGGNRWTERFLAAIRRRLGE